MQPSELIERLKVVYEVRSLEDLAPRLDVKLRTLQRWAANDAAPEWGRAIDLLQRAGWITPDADGRVEMLRPRDPLATLEETVEAQGRATTTALKALTAGIRRIERRLEAEAPQAKRKDAAR